jgi:hypothetical protein
VQHALRAYTPRDTKAVKAAADTFRPNPELNTFDVITQLGVGEALVSTLEDKGVPSMVQRTLMRPPSSRIGTITDDERKKVIAASPIGPIYDKMVDRESAFEILQGRFKDAAVEKRSEAPAPAPAPRATMPDGSPAPTPEQASAGSGGGWFGGVLGSIFGTSRARGTRLSPTQRITREVTRTVTNRVAGQIAADIGKSVGGSIGGSVGRAIIRGALGGILRG